MQLASAYPNCAAGESRKTARASTIRCGVSGSRPSASSVKLPLAPALIEKGYVYIAESPLYEITTKDRTYFAYTEPEKTAFLEEIGEKKYTIQRSKGLGENDPEMMWLTTMNPESRRLIKVMPTDVVQTAQVFDILLGDNLAGRKEHIAQHGAEYLDDLDVS